MTVIKLLGEAGRRYTREIDLEVATPVEAIQALDVLFPGFRQYLIESEERGIGWKVVTDNPEGTAPEDLVKPMGDRLILAPIISGKGPIGLIIAGATLAGVGALVPGVSFLLNLGLALFFQGLAALLSPTPRPTNKQKSFLFTASEAGTYQGTFVPVIYGETVVQAPPRLSYGLSLSAQEFVG